MNKCEAQGSQGSETILHDNLMVDTWHYAFVQTHGMHKTKNEP